MRRKRRRKRRKKKELEESEEKVSRRKKREEKRKQRELRKLKVQEAEDISVNIVLEERRLLIAQRKLESIRLLDELFERVKEVVKQREAAKKIESESKLSSKIKKEDTVKKKEQPAKEVQPGKESVPRNNVVDKYKSAQEQVITDQRTRLRSVLAASSTVCRSVDAKSETSISMSEESVGNEEDNYQHPWEERRNSDKRNFYDDSTYKDRRWYHQKSYRGNYHHSRPYYHKNYHSRFQHRGRFSGQRRCSYVPYWQRTKHDGTYKQDAYDYADIGREYYRYFKKLAGGDKEQSLDTARSKSGSPLTSKQPRSKSRSWSRSRSRSSRSSRTSKYSWSEDKDRSSWSGESLGSYDYSHSSHKKSSK